MTKIKYLLLLLFSVSSFNGFPFVDKESFYEIFCYPFKEGGFDFFEGLDDMSSQFVRTSWLMSDTTVVVENRLPLYECKPDSPLSRAIDLYLSQFEAFANDSVYSKSISHEGPYATLVGVDENKDGSYFLFTNLNSFVPTVAFLDRNPDVYCVTEYKGHLFLLFGSLLGNLIPKNTEREVVLPMRRIILKWNYQPTRLQDSDHNYSTRTVMPERPEEGEIIYRFTKFIPWRQVK